MSWAYLNDIRDRFRRKPKPVIYLDCKTRAQVDERIGEVLFMAYKKGDGPVKTIKISS